MWGPLSSGPNDKVRIRLFFPKYLSLTAGEKKVEIPIELVDFFNHSITHNLKEVLAGPYLSCLETSLDASMASATLTSFMETIKLFTSLTNIRFEDADNEAGQYLSARIKLTRNTLRYMAKRSKYSDQIKLVEEKVRIIASEAEYSLEVWIYDHNFSTKRNHLDINEAVILAVEEIGSMGTDMLMSLVPQFLNYEKEMSDYRPRMIVDFRSVLKAYIYRLDRLSSGLETITLSGWNCTEKRALARQIYVESSIQNSFALRVWVTVLAGDRVKDLLQRLLHSVIENFPDDPQLVFRQQRIRLDQMSNQQLSQYLSQLLEGLRFFIVIDNLTCSKTWDEIKSSFPENNNGSRLLFTTSSFIENTIENNFEEYWLLFPASHGVDYKMFDHIIFGKGSCPQELEVIKLDILYYCGGSPPAVIMVAKYLSTIGQTMDNWLKVHRCLKDNVDTVLKDRTPGIILALLEASEDIDTIDKEERRLYSDKIDPTLSSHLETEGEKESISSVGLEECSERLLSELVQSSPQIEILAIVGMAGIGKTTLAKRIFYSPCVSDHFHPRAWVKISQVYRRRDLLLQLLRCINQLTLVDVLEKDDAELETMLYKSLKGRRYLIVMDDLWSIKAWSEIKRILPDDKTGSRVLLISRQSKEIEDLNCHTIHRMSLLSETNCWDLLQKKVFGNDICPPDLVDIGKQIVAKCKGLPLAIIVIAGVLLKINKTSESWESVAESVSSVVLSNQNPCQAIFALSYQHLPHHLKPCFLYMGAFPEGFEVAVRTLIKLWIAEGFIDQLGSKSLEDVAEDYLNDLVSRSLLLVGRRRSNKRVKTCHMHDLLLEFCVQGAKKEKFMHVIKDFRQIHSEGRIDTRCRLSFQCHAFDDIYLTASKSLAVSALFFRECYLVVPDILLYYLDFKFLTVLDMIPLRFDTFPVEQVAKLHLLRYLALTASFELPSIVFKLRKLETLIVNGPWFKSTKISALPPEFWKCANLRHLQLRVANHLLPLKNPPLYVNNHLLPPGFSIPSKYLVSLRTLSRITLSSCSRLSFTYFPNLVELGVCETHEDFLIVGLWDIFFQDLVLLRHVQTLKLSCFGRNTRPLPMPSLNAFPPSLKKLTLWRSHLPWEAMTSLGKLPYLEVLKLKNYAFQGPEWNAAEGGFQRLIFLLIEETDLEVWSMEASHFPHLQRLVLKFCTKLQELPNEVGDMPALGQIELHFCSGSAERSVKEIKEEQLHEYCNNIEVLIRSHRRAESTSSVEELDE